MESAGSVRDHVSEYDELGYAIFRGALDTSLVSETLAHIDLWLLRKHIGQVAERIDDSVHTGRDNNRHGIAESRR